MVIVTKKNLGVLKCLLFLIIIFAICMMIVDGNKKVKVITSNVNNVKSIKSSRIINEPKEFDMIYANNVDEIKKYGGKLKLGFIGTLTGYGPDCPGCIGMVYCSPNPIVLDGNIYYEDREYGTLRILAADYSIPCGSIIKIENFRFIPGDEFYGIVLDRGSAIVGLTMDLLYPSEDDTVIVGRQRNIIFTIERWGW